MKKFIRLPVFILTITFSLFPIALRAQDQAPLAAGGGGSAPTTTSTGITMPDNYMMDDGLSPEQTISMDLQDANLRDVLKIFSIQSGLNFMASDAVENKKITVYLDKVPIKLAMDKLFDTNKLLYEFDEDAGIFVVRGKEEAVDLMTEVFRLRYRSVKSSNLEKQRIGLFSGSSSGGGGGGSGTASGSAADTSDLKTTIQQMLSSVGKVSEDNKTNSLIITDVPSRFPQIRALIASLDMPQAQVMLDIEMLDVSKDLIDKLGFNFNDGSIFQLGMTMANKSGLAFPFSSSSVKGSGVGTEYTAGSVNFGGSPLAVNFDLLKKNSDTKLLARPRILTLNNETAEIGITKDEIVSRERTTTIDAGGNNVDTYEYTRSSSLSLTPEGIGVFLRVTPMINEDTGEIILVVNPKSSSTTQSAVVATGSGEINLDPEVRASKSIIKIRDGETVVLGGLIKMEKQVTKAKLAGLGDIPILGMLFRSKDQQKNLERELLVFITPHIIKDEASLLSGRKKGKVPGKESRQRSQGNKVTLFTRHEAVNTALNNFDDR